MPLQSVYPCLVGSSVGTIVGEVTTEVGSIVGESMELLPLLFIKTPCASLALPRDLLEVVGVEVVECRR